MHNSTVVLVLFCHKVWAKYEILYWLNVSLKCCSHEIVMASSPKKPRVVTQWKTAKGCTNVVSTTTAFFLFPDVFYLQVLWHLITSWFTRKHATLNIQISWKHAAEPDILLLFSFLNLIPKSTWSMSYFETASK